MWRTVWRGMLTRKLRLVLSGLAVVLGVGFISGSQIFAQTLERHLTGTVTGGVPEVVVQPDDAEDQTARLSAGRIDEDLVARVAALPQVARAEGEIRVEHVYVLDGSGDPLSPIGAPALGFNYHDLPAADGQDGMTIASGSVPAGPDEVSLDVDTVARGGFSIGQDVTVVTPVDGPREFTLTGSVQTGLPLTGGSTVTVFDTPTAQESLAGGPGQFHRIGLLTDAASSPQQTAEAVTGVLPPGVEARTSAAVVDRAVEEMGGTIATMRMVLLGFAGLSVLVGGFLIVNTFSMLVQQRRQEIALLRTIGARARQVQRLVLGEAALLGALASGVGILAGIGLAAVLMRLFSIIGADLVAMGLVITWPPLVVAFAVGVVSTVLAAWIPARSTSRIAPVEALRAASVQPGPRRARTLLGAVALLLGLLGLVAVITRVSVAPPVAGLGLVLTLVGLVLLAPVLVLPFTGSLGPVASRLLGSVGTLAQRNAERNPRRTGATVAALVVGLALVSTLSVVANSVRSSVSEQLQDGMAADLVVGTPNNSVLPEPLRGQVAGVEGVATVSGASTLPVEVEGSPTTMAAEDRPATITRVEVVEGRLESLDATHVAVDTSRAAELGVGVGDTVAMTSNGTELELTIGAVYQEMPSVVAPWLADKSLAESFGWPAQDIMVGVLLDPGADLGTVRAQLDAQLSAYPLVAAYDTQEFAQLRLVEVDQMAGLVYVLLAVTVLISLLGVVNTLALSVVERHREIGMLRAVGLRRRGVRRLVRVESLVICLAGAVIGVAAGALLGATVHRLIEDTGIVVLDVPWAQLAAFVLVAGIIGMAAAALPARTASRTDVLDAIKAP